MNRLLIFALASLSSHAAEIRWSASGTVDSVNGSGFDAMSGDPVTVRFSYDSGAESNQITYLGNPVPFYTRTEYFGPLMLVIEITIGEAVWKGTLEQSAKNGTLALLSEAYNGFPGIDLLSAITSSADAAALAPFPYSGAAETRQITVRLRDTTAPADFLTPGVFPDATTPVNSITDGSGSIVAGTDSIHFTIDPATVTVESDEPRFPLTIKRTLEGIELRWPTENGTGYRLEESDTLSGWSPYGSYPGTGAEIVVTLDPFEDHPERRYYRVVTE